MPYDPNSSSVQQNQGSSGNSSFSETGSGWLGKTINALTGKSTADAAEETNRITEENYIRENEIAEKNYLLEEENLTWQKGVQQTTWDREDNAIQRRVADLKAAGLSPVLAAGQGARAGEVVKTTAPKREHVPKGTEGALAKMQAAQFRTQMARQAMTQVADISKTLAETDLIKQQKEKLDIETDFNQATFNSRMKQELDKAIHSGININLTKERIKLVQNTSAGHKIMNEYKSLDLKFKKALDEYLWDTRKNEMDPNATITTEKSPYIMQWQAALLNYEINKHNLDIAKDSKQPVGKMGGTSQIPMWLMSMFMSQFGK